MKNGNNGNIFDGGGGGVDGGADGGGVAGGWDGGGVAGGWDGGWDGGVDGGVDGGGVDGGADGGVDVSCLQSGELGTSLPGFPSGPNGNLGTVINSPVFSSLMFGLQANMPPHLPSVIISRPTP